MTLIYPSLLQVGNIIDSHHSFDYIIRKNTTITPTKKTEHIQYSYIDTIIIKLKLTTIQQNIIQLWMNDCIKLYNIANNYIKENYNHDSKIINFIYLRKLLNDKIREICKENNLNKHTADYAIKHCVEMYKSALSNHKKDFSKFNIKNLKNDRRKKNIIIEPASVSKTKNSIFVKILGNITSTLPLNIIKKNSILQYDKYKKTYIIICPLEKSKEKTISQYKRCGIDIGIRTFLTVYSPEQCLEIGTNNNKIIDNINKKLDKIKSNYDKKVISKIKKEKLSMKYREKIYNKINDVHNKTANMLLRNYKEIVIG